MKLLVTLLLCVSIFNITTLGQSGEPNLLVPNPQDITAAASNGSISGLKFHDVNGNGFRDLSTDVGLMGWKIKITGPRIDSTFTDVNGNYSFTNLPNGQYTVSEETQAGWLRTFPANPGTHSITITGSSSFLNINFGNWPNGIIKGKLFDDKNGNGSFDSGEPGLTGWVVKLTGSMSKSTTTDATGNYEFLGLQAGTYTLAESLQTGWIVTSPPSGSYTFSTIVGTRDTTKNFGNFKSISISGQKFNDKNGNGVKDAGDNGLQNWKILLAGAKADTATTDASGNYTFSNLGPGTYTLTEELQTGWQQTTTTPAAITAVSGTNVGERDFGNFQRISISGQKYHDKNADGNQDAGEEGLSNWRIRLSGSKIDSILTDSNGNYTFSNLGPGTYTLTEAVQTGWLQTTTNPNQIPAVSGTNETGRDFGNFKLGSISGMKFNDKNKDSLKVGNVGLSGWKIRVTGTKTDSGTTDASGNYTISNLPKGSYTVSEVLQSGWLQTFPASSTHSITIDTSSTVITAIDFGNYKLGTISGQKFDDKNGNGSKDAGDVGILGWEIRVTGAKNDSATTDASGNYTISNLPIGNYTVTEVLQSGWQQTFPILQTYTVVIDTSNSVRSGNDFGNFKLINISGQKFDDKNGNGVKDTGDNGLQNWKILLAGEKVDSTTTDASGNYTFSNLGPGTYTLTEELQTDWQQTTTNPAAIAAVSGTNVSGRDFGNFQRISISGQKYHDKNGNGVKDAGDNGLSGWKIKIAGAKVDSAITDASGNYTFSNLGPGTYTLTEELQTGWQQTTTNPTAITAVSGTNVVGIDFGNFQRISISGQKYHDKNANGNQNAGEEGLPNWRIRLSGSKIDSILTDSNGNYTFSNLGPGTYTLTEAVQTGWLQTTTNPSQIPAVSGTNETGRDFGNFKFATISGQKFNDKNGNGVKEAGEVGLSGWKIRVTGTKTDSGTTDASGNYTISNLPTGFYTVSEILESGWVQTFPASSTYSITIDTSSTVITEIDFGNYKFGIIAGRKFNDINGNGQLDNSEAGLPNWKIKLSGSKIDSLYTDINGNYSFNNLQPGSYELSEELQLGWMQTYPGEPFTYSITFDTSGFISASILFGNFKLPTISGYKFDDINSNGTKEPNETGLEGWEIKLSGDRYDSVLTNSTGYYEFLGLNPGKYVIREVQQTGWVLTSLNPDTIEVTSAGSFDNINFGNFKLVSISGQKYHDLNGNGAKDYGEDGIADWKIAINGPVVDTVLTDENGNYVFNDLGPGTYSLTEVPKAGWVQTSSSPSTIDSRSGEDVTNINFGNFQLVTVSGYKFEDRNGNGVHDNGEPGIPNWIIYINGTKIDSTQTNGTGEYTFNGLPPGTYIISEKQVAGWYQTVPPPPGTYTVNINQSGLVINGKDFGNYQTKSISGRKFQDVNGDGIEDANEPGLDGWIIVLQGSTGTQKDTTDFYGSYRFEGLPDGNYTISEENQFGWIQTMPPQTNPSYYVTLAAGQSITGKNFGNFSLGIVQGFVFEDKNGNGINNSEDVVVEGRTIQLIRDGNLVASQVTDNEGKYKFIAVSPGLYSVKLLPTGLWVNTSPNSLGVHSDTMTVGGFHRFKDFGTFKVAAIGGQKFKDVNGNGIKEAGEDGLSNWKIYLSGPKSDSTMTDINGSYRFTNLEPGTYNITASVMQNWVQTFPQSGKHTILVLSGMDSNGFHFGNFEKASISGAVYFDKNADGVSSPGDDYQNNWKVILRKFSDGKIDTTRTSTSGVYAFGDVAPDSFIVSIEFKTGWLTITPSSGVYGVKVQSGQQVTNKDFGVYKDTTLFRTFLQTDLVQKSVNLKKRRPPVPMPTAGNVLDSTFKRIGWKASGLTLGIPRTDSAKYYGWVLIRNPFFPPFYRSYIFPHTGAAKGFDTYDGKPWKGRKGMFFRRHHDNHLAGELLALKVSLAASDVGITPKGLGNLLFVDPNRTTHQLNGKNIRQIVNHIDTALTHYQWFANRPDYFKILDTALTRINQAFVGVMDTLKTSPLIIRGVRSLEEVPFLRPNPFPPAEATLPMVDAEMDIPERFTLFQNYPNPFNASTIIQYQITQPATVTIKLYNTLGQEVATFIDNEVLEEGIHGLEFNAHNLASGVYFYRIVAEGINDDESGSLPERFIDVKKMILLK